MFLSLHFASSISFELLSTVFPHEAMGTGERVFHRMEEPPDDQFLTYVLNLDRLCVPNQPKLDDSLKLIHIKYIYLIQITYLKKTNLNNNP